MSVSFLSCPSHADAQAETGYDLVAEVNVLRESYGLEPYTIDPWIMDYAQQHSQYQADIQTSTHLHSDGTNSLSVGLRENVAGGDIGYVTIPIVVYQIWADPVHMNTMTGYASGEAGAGVAVDVNNTIYYTLNVRPGKAVSQTTVALPTTAFIPIITSTPIENGNIIHIVETGETLWGIAVSYGVTMDDIRSLNNIGSNETTIYEGQKLLIHLKQAASTPTQLEVTLIVPTMTPSPTLQDSPTPTLTESPTIAPTMVITEPRDVKPERTLILLIAGLGTAAIGLTIGLIMMLRKRR